MLITGAKGAYRKSCPSNLLIGSNFTFDPSINVFKGPKTCLLLVLEISNIKATYRKASLVKILMRSNLTFYPSFKVKLGSTINKMEELAIHLTIFNSLCFKSTAIYLYAFLYHVNIWIDFVHSAQPNLFNSIISPYLSNYLTLGTLRFCSKTIF